ncbi:transposase, partial [Pseudomonadales bacterium]|nr:transposase [Pseudomonadales bacterium]
MGSKRNQAYTEEFRKEAVKRSEQTGVTQAEVAKELGLSSQQIANWKRQFTRLSDKQFNTVDGLNSQQRTSPDTKSEVRDHEGLSWELFQVIDVESHGCIALGFQQVAEPP